MPSLGLLSSLSKSVSALSSYVRDGLKLYMPYSSPKEVKFVGQGSTEFDGTGDYVDCNDPIISGTGDYTFIAWIKKGTDTASARNIAGNYSTPNAQGIQFAISAAEKFYTYTDGTNDYVTGATDIPLNVWTHVAATRSSNNAVVYVNGLSDATGSLDNDIGDSSDFTIGADPGGPEAYTGSIKNVAVWNRALSATEIQNVMYKTYADLSGTLSSGLVSWWALESDYLDSTSSDNDGTANGNPVQTASLYGRVTPLIPRGVDNAPTAQADAIGTGYAVFDGTDDYINTGATFQTTFDGSFTIAAWVKPDDGIPGGSTYRAILGSEEGGEDSVNFYIDPSGKLNFYYETNNQAKNTMSNSVVFTDGENPWHHCVAVINDTTNQVDLYFNGIKQVLDGTDDGDISGVTNANFETAVNLWIGARNDDGSVEKPFDGKIKNVGIWSAALTQPQIQSIMEKTYSELTSSEKTNLVSWWGLDSLIGDSDDEGVVPDEHGGTLGSELWDNDYSSGTGTFAVHNSNTISNDNGAVKIVFVDGDNGAQVNFADARDLNTNLTVGKTYKLTADLKQTLVNPFTYRIAATSGVGGTLHDITLSSTSSTFTTYTVYFVSANATDGYLRFNGMGSGEIVWIKNISLKEVSGNYGELR